MSVAEACEPTEGLTSNINESMLLCSLEGLTPFLVLLAQRYHTDSIPNSVVKRCCGEDTLGVAPRENSSVPGQYSTQKPLSSIQEGGFLVRRLNDLTECVEEEDK